MISKKFLFAQDITAAFVTGSCLDLANELSKLYNLEIYSVAPIDKNFIPENLRPFHHVCKYKQYYVDIEGMWTEQDLKRRWLGLAHFVGLNDVIIIKFKPKTGEICEDDYEMRYGKNMKLILDKFNNNFIAVAEYFAKEVMSDIKRLERLPNNVSFDFVNYNGKIILANENIVKNRYIYRSRSLNKDLIVLGSSAYSSILHIDNVISIIDIMSDNHLHPKITDILDYDDGKVILIINMIKGRSMYDIIINDPLYIAKGKFVLEEIIKILNDNEEEEYLENDIIDKNLANILSKTSINIYNKVKSAIQSMHKLGVYHGDLTAYDIFYHNGNVQILGFDQSSEYTANGYNERAKYENNIFFTLL